MDYRRIKKSFLILFLVFLTSCFSRKPEDRLIDLIETRYANLYVNNEPAKRAAIQNLKNYFKDHKLNDENETAVRKLLHKINDGHLVLFDSRKDKNIHYQSGINFIPGSNYFNTCDNCKPVLPQETYQLIQIDDLSLQGYLDLKRDLVAASTEWGREYRLIRLLKENTEQTAKLLKVKNSKGIISLVELQWDVYRPTAPGCVKGERVNDQIFRISVLSLWCEDVLSSHQDRDQIFENFKKQFDEAINQATKADNIILDLRENGGGGDREVEYVLNAFFPKSVFMYHYKYLRKTHPGKRKHLEKFWPFKLKLWSEDEYQNTDYSQLPTKQFLDNKLSVLISPGCFSSCETIASTLKHEKRGKILGTQTHGGSGDPVIFPINGTSYSLNIPTSLNWQKNNELFEGVGVKPDEEVAQSNNGLSDEVLTRAIDLAR